MEGMEPFVVQRESERFIKVKQQPINNTSAKSLFSYSKQPHSLLYFLPNYWFSPELMRVLSLSFVALAASAFVPEALALANPIKNNLEIVHGAQPKDYSANYISVFARAEDPDVEFELVDAPAKSIRGKIVSLRRRGIAGCEEEYTGKSWSQQKQIDLSFPHRTPLLF